jgi:hypothetical protein
MELYFVKEALPRFHNFVSMVAGISATAYPCEHFHVTENSFIPS